MRRILQSFRQCSTRVNQMTESMRTILALSLSGSVLALILFAGKPLFKNRATKSFSYYIWLLVLLRLVIPISSPFHFMDSYFNGFNGKQTLINPIMPVQTGVPGRNLMGMPQNPGGVPNAAPDPSNLKNSSAAAAQIPENSGQSFKEFDFFEFMKAQLLWLWLTGAVIRFGWFLAAYIHFSGSIRNSFTSPHSDDLEVFNSLYSGRRVKLVCSSKAATPMLIGVLRPVIVLPERAWVETGMEEELKYILLHELVHFKRKDILYKWVVILITSLHWFNPLMVMIRREISRSCELACDEMVISGLSSLERKCYGNMLLAFAAKKGPSLTLPATTLCEDKKTLEERLIGIKGYKRKSVWSLVLTFGLALLLTGCAWGLGTVSNRPDINVAAEIPVTDINVTAHIPASDMNEEIIENNGEQTPQDDKIAVKGDFDGDGLADFVSAEKSTNGVVLTVNLGNGALSTKSIDSADVSWLELDALEAGDLDGDGKDEIVFSPPVFGSNYGARSLYVFRMDGDTLAEMPLNLISNASTASIASIVTTASTAPTEFKQPESLNDEYKCIRADVINTNDGQLLRIRLLISARANSAWYMDVHWNGEGWQMERVSKGAAYGEEVVYQYNGNVFVEGKLQEYAISVKINYEKIDGSSMELAFSDSDSGQIFQHLIYNDFRDDFMPDTIQEGVRILDVNHDANDDIMLDLGVYGWARLYACFVYDSSVNAFVQVPDFEEHPFPEVLSDQGLILFRGQDGAAVYWADKYRVEGNALQKLGRLTKIFGQTGERYTEETMVNGMPVVVKENVTAADIEDLNAWHLWD